MFRNTSINRNSRCDYDLTVRVATEISAAAIGQKPMIAVNVAKPVIFDYIVGKKINK